MARSKETYNKKELETARRKKRDEKAKRKLEQKQEAAEGGKKSFESMIAYVDEFGRLTNEPPDLTKKKKAIDPDSIEISVARRVESEEDSILTGKVAFFNTEKGYGFIKDSIRQESFFVHMNDLKDAIKENDMVTFTAEPGQKGMKAVDVKLVVK